MKIAITGAIGSGKSLVLSLLRNLLKCKLCDADVICFQLMKKNNSGWVGVVEKWGDRFLLDDGEIDRALLAKEIFSNKDSRFELEAILHPMIKKEINNKSEQYESEDGFVLVEVPLLFEVGWENMFDWIVTVHASECQCCQRIMTRDGCGSEEAMKIIKTQWASYDKAILSNSVIDNSASLTETVFQIIYLSNMLKKLDTSRFAS